jgi:hypothetical protein
MATREQVRQMINARPFRPYLIKLADGQTFEIRHPELVSCSLNGREMQINTEDGLVLAEMLLVSTIDAPATSDNEPYVRLGPGGMTACCTESI